MKKTILYLPEKSGQKPNACSFLRLISPLSRLVNQQGYVVNELVSLGQLFKSNVIGLTTNRTAFLDFPGLLELIENGLFPAIGLHWDTDDYSGRIQESENEFSYLQKLRRAQQFMERHASVITTSTKFIRDNSDYPEKWHVVPNSIPIENWETITSKRPHEFLFFGLQTHAEEIQRLSDSFDNIKWKRLKESKISIHVMGNFEMKLNRIFKVTKAPDNTYYYPRFSRWIANHSSQLTGLVLIKDSTLNQGKSALKFLEYSAMGMSVAGYQHMALDSDSASENSYFQISRQNPAEDLIDLIEDQAALQESANSNSHNVRRNRGIDSDAHGMFQFLRKKYSSI